MGWTEIMKIQGQMSLMNPPADLGRALRLLGAAWQDPPNTTMILLVGP
jgi:hypothetical protein